MTPAAKCAQPCATCPWRQQQQTPAAVAASPADGRGEHWFSVSNLRRQWNHIRKGGMLPCHMTDPDAPLYGGKAVKRGVETRVCAGLAILTKREVHAYLAAGGRFANYRKLGGQRMTQEGLAMWAARHVWPGATHGTFSLSKGHRQVTMPAVDDHPDVRLPWRDPVHHPPRCDQ
jgi:hypothetical protein